MLIDAVVIKTEIVADSAIGYKNSDGSWKDNATIAALMNTPKTVSTGTQDLTPPLILEAIAPASIANIQDAAESPSGTPVPSATGRALAKTALLYINTGQALNVTGPAGQTLVTALQSAGLLTAQDVANLQAAAVVTAQQSRAQALWGTACVVSAADVARAALA